MADRALRMVSMVVLAAAVLGCGGGATPPDGSMGDGGDASNIDAGSIDAGPSAVEACAIACELDERSALRPLAQGCAMDQRESGLTFFPGHVDECASDDDCTLGDDGRCLWAGPPRSACTYHQCETSADCRDEGVCVCAAGPRGQNRCIVPFCEPCGVRDCRLSIGCGGPDSLAHGAWGLACSTPGDECGSSSECQPLEFCTRGPEYLPLRYEASFRCMGQTCGW